MAVLLWSVGLISWAAVVAVVPATVVLRRRISAGPVGRAPGTAYDIAFLAGEIEEPPQGRRRVVFASIARLRALGAILVTPHGNTGATSRLPSDRSELDDAVHRAAAAHLDRSLMFDDQEISEAITGIRRGLVDTGWLLSDDATRRWRRLGLLPVPVMALGMGQFAAALITETESLEWALWPLPPLLFASVLVWTSHPPRVTRAARRIVRSRRQDNQQLSPAHAPAWSAVGADGAALAVALYGEAALRASDPAYTGERR